MRFISLKVVAAVALSLCTVPLARGSDVQDADKFAFGGIGVAGTMSKGERALRASLDQPDAATQLERKLPHATDAGRLYILVGVRMHDRSAYKRAFDAYSQHDGTVETVQRKTEILSLAWQLPTRVRPIGCCLQFPSF